LDCISVNKLFLYYAAGSGGGQGDTEDLTRLHVELETKDQELRAKNEMINHLVKQLHVEI